MLMTKLIENVINAFEYELKKVYSYSDEKDLWCTVDRVYIDFIDADYENDMKSINLEVSYGRYVENGNNNFTYKATLYDIDNDDYNYLKGVAHVIIQMKDGLFE